MKKKIIAFLLSATMIFSGAITASASITYMPDVTAQMAKATYWSAKEKDASTVLAKENAIKATNAASLTAEGTNMYDLKNQPETVDGVALSDSLVNAVKAETDSFVGKNLDADGNVIKEGYFDEVVANCENTAATKEQAVKYAVAVNRTDLLIYPSYLAVLDDPGDNDFDNIYNSGVRVNEPMIIRSVSKDKKFYYVRLSHCTGWVPAEDVAICKDKAEWLAAWDIDWDEAAVVYGSKVYTEDSLTYPEVANRMLTMGTVLELASPDEYTGLVTNRATYHNLVVWMPVRATDGSYKKELALISESKKMSEGYLPLTKENISMVAFGMLGNAYGWGGMLSSEDCSGYVRDVYKCFGYEMPRNTSWQKVMPVKKFDLSEYTDDQKKELLGRLPLGSVLFFSGHEMIYLGSENGKYYVISSTSSIMNPDESGKLRARGVIINTLDIKRANGNTWLTSLNAATIPYYDPSYELPEKDDPSTVDTKKDINTLKLTAKKGTKKLIIKSDKGCKLVVTANKKIFKGDKKKYTIKSSAKTNTVKLAKTLKKGMKITVQATKSGYNAKKVSVTVK